MEVYLNDAQMEVLYTGARDTVAVMGRGCGKSIIHAAKILQWMQQMPRSTGGIVAANAKRARTNTLPSMLQHWEKWGYRRGIHYVIGHQPPKSLRWPQPLIRPEDWENVISFYNGSIAIIISQDRPGTSNSLSLDWLDIDEAKFINFEQLKDETFPANRGQQNYFGDVPDHHGMLITSDMPVTKKGGWFLRYREQMNGELIEVIQGLVHERWRLMKLQSGEHPQQWHRDHIREIDNELNALRRHALFYKHYSSLYNLQVLGEEFILRQKRDLPALTFLTSIMCEDIGIKKDGFYGSLTPAHKYSSTDFHHLDSLAYDFGKLSTPDCRMDGDLLPGQPLCIAFDFNANINWLVVGQPDEEHGRMNTVKSFWVKYERKLEALCRDFDTYYKLYPTREVVFYYDHTALGNNYAVNNQDYQWVITHTLRLLGWVVRPVYIGRAWGHMDKHLLINRALCGRARLTPYFNEQNNEDLLISIQTAGVYNGKKDKRGEKLAETTEDRLENRTDGSDARDTLFIGCEKFPQRRTLALGAVSGVV